jgi:ferric-dicitrate binding protein FerR (iron transport regulator)
VYDLNLIAGYLSGNCSESERRQLDLWRSEVGNDSLFNEVEKVWTVSGKLKLSTACDTDEAWRKFTEKQKGSTRKGPALRWKRAALAAAVVGAAVLINVLAMLFSPVNSNLVSDRLLLKSLPAGTTAVKAMDSAIQFYLPDSSRVWLNKGGCIRYNEFGDERNVLLNGEAFFEVRPDLVRPFHVRTSLSMTQAVGTAFNIRSSRTETEVEVLEGTVQVNGGGAKKMVLRAGEAGRITAHRHEIRSGLQETRHKRWWRIIPCKLKQVIRHVKRKAVSGGAA